MRIALILLAAAAPVLLPAAPVLAQTAPAPKPAPAKPAPPKPATPKPAGAKPVAPPAAKPAAKPAAQPAARPAGPARPPQMATPPAAAAPLLTAAPKPQQDAADIARVNAAMNAIVTLQADFVQTGPNGEQDLGKVYLSKPGRMRFEYAKPSPYLIVADGVSVAVGNSDVKTVDRYPLIDNPLSLVLNTDIDLAKDAEISRIDRRGGQLWITATRNSGDMRGQVTLIFAEPSLDLKQWIVTDAQGLQTMITLQNVKTGVTIEPDLFILRDVNKFADPRE
jgi:outer membrane lipoprotein-sorting protein